MKFALEMGLRNSVKSIVKLIFIPLLLCMGLMVIGITVQVSDQTIRSVSLIESDYLAQTRISVLYPGNAGIIKPVDIDRIKALDGVQCVCNSSYFFIPFGDEKDPNFCVSEPILGVDLENQWLNIAKDYRGQGVSGVIIPDTLRSLVVKDKHGNDTIETKYTLHQDEETPQVYSHVFPVLEIYKANKNDGNYQYTFMTEDLYAELLKENEIIPQARSLIIYLSKVDAQDSVLKSIQDMGYHAFLMAGGPADYLKVVDMLRSVGLSVGITMVVLALIVVLQALNASIRRREKAIGVMKAFGYRESHLVTMLLSEISVYAILGFVLSVLARIFLAKIITEKMAILFANTSYSYSLLQFGIDTAVVGIFILFSLLKPMIRCRRLSPIEILKTSNG